MAARSRGGALALADFAPLVGSGFDVDAGAGRSLRFTLVEAVDRPAKAMGGRRVTGEAFSLLFVDARSTAGLPGATYSFAQPALGAFGLFVTPLGPGSRGLTYEAVVNRQALAP